MKVLIVPEDFRKDRYVLEPVVAAMIEHLGRRNANVRVCMDPLLGGVVQALRWQRIEEILERYKGMVDLFVLCVDRDGDPHRQVKLDDITTRVRLTLSGQRGFFAVHAWQEIEVWLLAGHDLPKAWVWKDIRDELDPKERYFVPFAVERGVADGPAGGRARLGKEAARRYDRIKQRSPEVAELEKDIGRWLVTRP